MFFTIVNNCKAQLLKEINTYKDKSVNKVEIYKNKPVNKAEYHSLKSANKVEYDKHQPLSAAERRKLLQNSNPMLHKPVIWFYKNTDGTISARGWGAIVFNEDGSNIIPLRLKNNIPSRVYTQKNNDHVNGELQDYNIHYKISNSKEFSYLRYYPSANLENKSLSWNLKFADNLEPYSNNSDIDWYNNLYIPEALNIINANNEAENFIFYELNVDNDKEDLSLYKQFNINKDTSKEAIKKHIFEEFSDLKLSKEEITKYLDFWGSSLYDGKEKVIYFKILENGDLGLNIETSDNIKEHILLISIIKYKEHVDSVF